MHPHIVFCDFDGTVTVQETFSTMLVELAPAGSAKVLEDIFAQRTTLARGIRLLLESMPSSAYGDIIDFSLGREIRPGFEELLDFLDERQTPFVLVSGGLHVMIQAILGPLTKRMAGVYALSLDLSGPTMKVVSEFEQDAELLAKVQVMDLHPCGRRTAIGDGLTDLNMGMAAHTVFARGGLAKYMTKKGREFFPWEDFHDVKNHLAALWR